MKEVKIPEFYKSGFIGKIKDYRKNKPGSVKDLSPTRLDFGNVEFILPRHFGFCFGVENAINIAYKTLEENPGRRILLLSEMIHNPDVNRDLESKGVGFIMDSHGKMLMDWEDLKKDDIIVVPAFGTTVEIENMLNEKGYDLRKYNTTCPFVTKVWRSAATLGKAGATVVIHGKYYHEETKATFSHSMQKAPSVVVRNFEEADLLVKVITGEIEKSKFYELFKDKYSEGFDVEKDLQKIGVVNQTTMLAHETEKISSMMRGAMVSKFGEKNIDEHFCDTKDTLCYATNNNQGSTKELFNVEADAAFVVGGYNSSNTSHIAELLGEKFTTYFITSEKDIISENEIKHYSIEDKTVVTSNEFFPKKEKVTFILTSGASCPDTIVEGIMIKILNYYGTEKDFDDVIESIV